MILEGSVIVMAGTRCRISCVLYGRRDSVVFVGDVTADGTMDTVTWYVTDTLSTQALRNYWHIENKSVKLLIRIDRNPGHIPYIQTDTFAFGVTQFSIFLLQWKYGADLC